MEELQDVMEEEVGKEEIRQTVENEEFWDKLTHIPSRYSPVGNRFSDAQIAELSRPFVDILEAYRRYFENDYDGNGKLVKETIYVTPAEYDAGESHVATSITTFEYDSEGCLVKSTTSTHSGFSRDGSWGDDETVSTYSYNEKGFTELHTYEIYSNGQLVHSSSYTADYEIVDEYGNYEILRTGHL